MSALSMILQPSVERPSKEEIDEAIRARPTKRQKLSPAPDNSKSLSPEKRVGDSKDDRKARWLSGLSHEELLGVAQGGVWQVGGLHSKNCFCCKKSGTLLECFNCPRSYHRRCLDPPIHGNFKIDGPWFCPNCELLKIEEEPSWAIERSVPEPGKLLVNLPTLRIGDVTPLHRSQSPRLPTRVLVSSVPRTRTPTLETQEREKAPRRSRYSTLPEHIDQALGLLNRELESAYQEKGLFRDMEKKIQVLEQEIEIVKGREMLRERVGDFGLDKEEVEKLKRENEKLRRENGELRDGMDTMKIEAVKKEREAEEWRRRVKSLIDGN